MPVNYFPDGFPQDAALAIEASYFLSEEEKQEWRNWLYSADENQKLELIETLHSIWIDQKQTEQQQQTNFAPAPQSAAQNYQEPVQNQAFNPDFNPVFTEPQGQTPQTVPQNAFQPQGSAQNQSFQQAPAYNQVQNQSFAQPVQNFQQSSAPIQQVQNPVQNQPAQNFGVAVQNANVFGTPAPAPAPSPAAPVMPQLVPEQAPVQTTSSASVIEPVVPELDIPDFTDEDMFDGFSFDDEKKDDLNQFATTDIDPATLPDLSESTTDSNYVEGHFGDEKPVKPLILTPVVEAKSSQAPEASVKTVNIEKDEIKDEVEKMLENANPETDSNSSNSKVTLNTDSINTTPQSVMVETVEDDYEKEITRNKKYQKAAEVSLLSAKQVSELYSTFTEAQAENTKLEQEFQSRQAKLFDKIMEMVTEASVLSDKVLRLNDQVVGHASSIQDLKNTTAARGSSSLQNQINSLREEIRKVERSMQFSIESVDREFNDFRSEITAKIQEMSMQLASAVADTYKADGVYEKMAKLQGRIELLESSKKSSDSMFKTPFTKSLATENKAVDLSEKLNLSIRNLKNMNSKAQE